MEENYNLQVKRKDNQLSYPEAEALGLYFNKMFKNCPCLVLPPTHVNIHTHTGTHQFCLVLRSWQFAPPLLLKVAFPGVLPQPQQAAVSTHCFCAFFTSPKSATRHSRHSACLHHPSYFSNYNYLLLILWLQSCIAFAESVDLFLILFSP